MSDVYAMQRANGDWFALRENGRFRVPIFSSHAEAMKARSFNVEMLIFKPVQINDHALKDLASTEGGSNAYFWMVETASTNMKRGVALQHDDLARLIRASD